MPADLDLTCVGCGHRTPPDTLFARQWLQLPGGCLCPACLDELRPGTHMRLGNGVRLECRPGTPPRPLT